MDVNQFSVQVYGGLSPYSHAISKARVRIFHRGFNRNGSYIPDDVAEKLVDSLAYAPVKGIFDQEKGDFLGHGIERHDGKAYGLVPNPTNFKWEKHIDPDGVEREYACADVLLWTGIYKEANEILGKSQSMELYSPLTKGSWQFVQGKYVFYYEDAAFAGLQVLGNEVEPCFLGSNFFAHEDQIEALLRALNGGTEMKVTNQEGYVTDVDLSGDIALESDFAKKYVIGRGASQVRELETEDNEEPVSDNHEEEKIEEVEQPEEKSEVKETVGEEPTEETTEEPEGDFTEEEEEESMEEEESAENSEEPVPPIKIDTPLVNQDPELKGGEGNENTTDISETPAEKIANEPVEVEVENFSAEENAQTIEVEENEGLSEREELLNLYNLVKAENAALKETITELESELVPLKEFKLSTERLEKDRVLDEYAIRLPMEFVDNLRDNLDQYSVDELEKEIGYYLLKNTGGNFSHRAQSVHKPKNLDGLQAILSRYKK